MPFKKEYGKDGQIKFENENEYYEALGYIADKTHISIENNDYSGAWGKEGRIKFSNDSPNISGYFKITDENRTNCNEYVKEIIDEHNFVVGREQNIEKILETIPDEYKNSFKKGLNCKE